MSREGWWLVVGGWWLVDKLLLRRVCAWILCAGLKGSIKWELLEVVWVFI